MGHRCGEWLRRPPSLVPTPPPTHPNPNPAADTEPRTEQRRWLLECARELWAGFRARFLQLWDEHGQKGDAYPKALFSNASEQVRCSAGYSCLPACSCLCAACRSQTDGHACSWLHRRASLVIRACSLLALLLPQGEVARQRAQAAFMERLWRDAVGFGGAVIVRRLVGVAHVADMDSIAGGWLGGWVGGTGGPVGMTHV